MDRKHGSRRHRHREEGSPARQAPDNLILAATVEALHWRLDEGATRIADARAALRRGQHSRAMEHLFELEPLVFEAGRILSATFLLARETTSTEAMIPE